ncbi:TetR/AcrR family transcriptional regulator [Streptomyces sp. CC228A]|uniref:TetR/AcrR family transcriptional regulator n=1 Tax=Streptomyces sp. CC228A TaxID=2898186 RepID=UPI0027E4F930|nr:TetR/AcrR family transcriptional regulator [Streptomyces sp. CC228A]
MSPKQQRGEATADRLMDAALRLYGTSGEQGLTVSAVTKASGVSLGSLYHHFGSLDGLAAALFVRWNERLMDTLVSALTRSASVRDGVRAVVEAYLGFVREHRDAALFLHASDPSRHMMHHGRQVREVQSASLAAIAAWLEPHVAAGEIDPLPGPLVESLVMGPVVATARRWLSGIDDQDLDEAARVLPDRIWRSLAPDPAAPDQATPGRATPDPAARGQAGPDQAAADQAGPGAA